MLDRLIVAAALVFDKTEQMKGLRVTGSDRQDLTAHPLRLSRASSALMCERRAEPSGDRRRRAACRATLLPQPGFDPPLLSVHWDLDSATSRYISTVAGNRQRAVILEASTGAREKEER
jgi:hypothetical protein